MLNLVEYNFECKIIYSGHIEQSLGIVIFRYFAFGL